MKTMLVATLGHSHKTVVNAVLQYAPDYLWIICTAQSEAKIANFESELRSQHAMPPLRGRTLVLHDNLEDIYQNIKHLLGQLENQYMVTFDLTGGTVPMSLGVWEAARHFPDVIISWIDNTDPPKNYIFNRPNAK